MAAAGSPTLLASAPATDLGAILDALTDLLAIQVMAIPLYLARINLVDSSGALPSPIEGVVLAEFAAASLLIAAGAVLKRLTQPQYLLLGALFVPLDALEEWILTQGDWACCRPGLLSTPAARP